MGFCVCNWGNKVLVKSEAKWLQKTPFKAYSTCPFQTGIQFQRSEEYTWQYRYKQYGAIV